MKFILEASDETLITHSGLALIGLLLSKTKLAKRLNRLHMPGIKSTPAISNADVAYSYIGLLCQGKNDFDHIEPYRKDEFFHLSLQVDQVPSSPTLRQRFDQAGEMKAWNTILLEESAALLRYLEVKPTSLCWENENSRRSYVPLDIDVSPFDNSGTKKEGVSRTYKGHDGYAPIFAYLGREGYGVHVQLREGSTHSQKDAPIFLEQSIRYAKSITTDPLLVRLDSGYDCVDNINICFASETSADFIIKRNPRREKAESWLMIAQQHGTCTEPREGKKMYQGSISVKLKGVEQPVRQVFEVVEETIDRNGQILLVPDISFATYWTSLPDEPSTIIKLYQDHGTSEQFHSEIKTDLYLERLPSGKLATNDLVLHFGLLAYNLLRFLGQQMLQANDTPIRKKAQRRRIRTVIQNLITLASKLVFHARKFRLRFGRCSPWLRPFSRIYAALVS